MGLQKLQFKYVDGDIPLDVTVATAAYFGGQPLRIQSSGASVATGDTGYLGVAHNSRFEDALNGKTGVLRGFKGQLLNGSDQIDNVVNNQTVEGIPYDNTVTYVEGNNVYINPNNSLWTNVQITGSPATPTAKGIVTRAPSGNDDSMEVYFYDVA